LKINSSKLITAILLASLFASCNTGNKVVSSFGKRKYTKGYYFNSVAHKAPELPAIVASGTNNQAISYKEKEAIHTEAVRSVSSESVVPKAKQKKISVSHLSQIIIGKVQKAFIKNTTENISWNSQLTMEDGIPGHGGTATDGGNDKYDLDATLGFIFGLVGLIFFFVDGFGILLAIPGLILSAIGLKSERKHGLALAGLILSIIAIVLAIIVIIAVIAILSAGI